MFKLITTATVLLLAGILMAEDAVVPATVPATAPATTPAAVQADAPVAVQAVAPAAAPAAVPVGPQLAWYGYAQYRLRGQLIQNAFITSANDFTATNYVNQIGYYFGTKVKVNDKVNMQFQIGNDWVTTEGVSLYSNNWATLDDTSRVTKTYPTAAVAIGKYSSKYPTKEGLYPYFHLAFGKYDAGFMNITAGIQPVASNGPLDLFERSIVSNENKMVSYASAALVGWVVSTQNSMAGLRVGAPILKGDFKLDASLFTSITEPRVMANANTNMSAVMLVLDLPMACKALTVTPQVASIINKRYDAATGNMDNEIGYGLAAGYKVNDRVTTSLSFGMASFSNAGTKVTNAKDTVMQGMVVGAGTAIKAGPGAVNFDIKYGSNENTKRDSTLSSNIFVDLKYGWDINKNFQLMPRVRLFQTTFAKSDPLGRKTALETRPELIFTSKF